MRLLPAMFNAPKKTVQRLSDKLASTRAQRDKARVQRDKTRTQRDELRGQLDVLRLQLDQQTRQTEAIAAAWEAAITELERVKQRLTPSPPSPIEIETPPGSHWPPPHPPLFYADGLAVWHKHPSFVDEEKFQRAYQRGMQSGHHIAREKGSSTDLHVEWRIHVLLWAAMRGAKIPGDFVECGVNTGIYSLAICDYLDFNTLSKRFWLFDTFEGIPGDQMSRDEILQGAPERSRVCYSDCHELVKANFSPWPQAIPVRGRVPETLTTVNIESVAYLSIDMNIVYPEIEAIKHFWPKLSSGACVVLDDYGWMVHSAQKAAFDAFASEAGVSILNLPTGQGLMFKP